MSFSRRQGAFGRFSPPDQAWLDGAEAEPTFPLNIAITDAHHHFWDRSDHRYLPADLAKDAAGLPLAQSIYVECRNAYRQNGPSHLAPVGETEWLLSLTRDTTSIETGIVGFADLTLGEQAGEVLDEHLALAGERFLGVRHSGAYDPDPVIGNSHVSKGPGLYLGDGFSLGLAELAKRDLVFDAFVFFHQLDDVIRIARRHEDLQIVLGHMGCPLGYGRHADPAAVFAVWDGMMRQLAELPNVHVKIGGLVTRLAAFDYFSMAAPPSSTQFSSFWAAYVDRTLELFGPSRAMFESNFPVCRMGIGYHAMWNGYARAAAGLSEAEQADLSGGTARRVYGLPTPLAWANPGN